MTQNKTLKIGHRGGKSHTVENTYDAFLFAINDAADGLECDIRITKDDQIVIFHDEDLSRLTSDDNRKIIDCTFDELQQVELQQLINNKLEFSKIPSLRTILELCKRYDRFLIIELKYSKGINPNDFSNINMLLELINSYKMQDNVIIMTSMKTVLIEIRKRNKKIKIQLLARENYKEHIDDCLKYKFDLDIMVGDHLTKEDIAELHKLGLKVNVWTVNSDETKEKLINNNVDMITTDYL